MTIAPANDNERPAEDCAAVPANAIVMLVAGVSAAWLAAGSTGLLAHSLQHALTWLALAVAIVSAWPESARQVGTWAILAVGVVLAVFSTASGIPTVDVLGVAIVLAAIAQVQRGVTARLAIIAAIAATALACFRFATSSIPVVWLAADRLGWLLGRAAGWLTGEPLEVGATFAGVDFLVLTAAVYVGWLVCTVSPRRSRALWGLAAIILGHFVYLVVLAYSEKLLAMLPADVLPSKSTTTRMGLWSLTNVVRAMIPWNVPLLAMCIHGGIIAAMVAVARWTPVVEVDAETLKRQKAREEQQELSGSALLKGIAFQFGPPLLAVAAMLSGALVIDQPDLKGKKVVAYEKGYVSWLKPEYDSTVNGRYGMLKPFVESLGGKFETSADLSKEKLAGADVLLLIHPTEPWSKETLDRIWDYVRGGGSLLLAAEPAVHEGKIASSFNDVLQPLSMDVRYDTAVMRVANWEQSYEITSHPATAALDGLRNRFGVQLGSSIAAGWLARPAIVGQWGWSDPGSGAALSGISQYSAGERLGDLVLAAEQPLGRGRVFVLGDTSPLQNDGLPNAFPFVGRVLSYLAHRSASPQDLWRQLCTLAALVAMVGLLAGRPVAWQVMLTSAVMGVLLARCTAVAYSSGRVLPDGRSMTAAGQGVAYVDASHLEAYASDSQGHGTENQGISEFLRTLMRQGYLPLLAPDLARDRLERCRLLVSIAPAREFSPVEQEAIQQFVSAGGTFLCMVGAEESRASADLLADFGFNVPHTPVLPSERTIEPAPLAAAMRDGRFGKNGAGQFQFYAPWPVVSTKIGEEPLVEIAGIGSVFIQERAVDLGKVVIIGDTYFATNENMQPKGRAMPDRVRFWRWLFSRVVPGQEAWEPPAATTPEPSSALDEEEDEGD
jgi:hypothetical protein